MFGLNTAVRSLVSIPLEQGNVFRHKICAVKLGDYARLNPFGTGQCLSTSVTNTNQSADLSLNPFGTGQCLSTCAPTHWKEKLSVSQSLWNRAMSFDDFHQTNVFQYLVSQSLWNRAMSFDRN